MNAPDAVSTPNADATVTVPLREYVQTWLDALCWRRWWMSDMVELRQEQAAWEERRKFRECSSAISGGADWSAIAQSPSHAELVRRRAEPVVPRRCGARNCRTVLSVPYPAPEHLVYCPRHDTTGEVTA